ncbi:MAG: rhodanese-like domain-containing protein [Acidobacteriaceae bacterium]
MRNLICFLDVREPWEAEFCALPGSRQIPMGDLPSCAHGDLDPEADIVIDYHHGVRLLSVVLWLREQGLEQAQSLAGGVEALKPGPTPSILP